MRASIFVAAATALGLLGVAHQTRASDLLSAIDEAHRTGQLSSAERTFYRVAAVRKPELLPPAWQKLAREEGLGVRCATPVLAEAFQALPQLDPTFQGKVRDLMLPPPDLAYSVEALTPYPVRVLYADPSQQAQARAGAGCGRVLLPEGGHGVRLVGPAHRDAARDVLPHLPGYADGAGGYTAPYMTGPTVLRASAFSYIFVDPTNDGDSIDTTVAHEFNHAVRPGWMRQRWWAFGRTRPPPSSRRCIPRTGSTRRGPFRSSRRSRGVRSST